MRDRRARLLPPSAPWARGALGAAGRARRTGRGAGRSGQARGGASRFARSTSSRARYSTSSMSPLAYRSARVASALRDPPVWPAQRGSPYAQGPPRRQRRPTNAKSATKKRIQNSGMNSHHQPKPGPTQWTVSVAAWARVEDSIRTPSDREASPGGAAGSQSPRRRVRANPPPRRIAATPEGARRMPNPRLVTQGSAPAGAHGPALVGEHDELHPVAAVELREDPGHVRLRGERAEVQPGADLLVAEALRH